MSDEKNLNELWSRIVIKQMLLSNITHCYVGYGSRSTPLVLFLSNTSYIQTHYHFDERGLAFHALGYAKESKNPVAIVVTSGSALANLYPAIMEAFEQELPVLILTADRPSELRSMGSNQTTDQARIFSNHVVWQCDYPPPDSPETIHKMSHSLSYAFSKLIYPVRGPVHINLMFREPLEFSPNFSYSTESLLNVPQYFPPEQVTNHLCQTLSKQIPFNRSGIIVVGSMDCEKEMQAIIALAEKLHWPILADITSNIRGYECPNIIAYYDLLLDISVYSELIPSCIIHFGNKMISKRWLLWNEKLSFIPYLHVSNSSKNYNPVYRLTHRFYVKATTFCDQIFPFLEISSAAYLNKWKTLSEEIKKRIHIFYIQKPKVSELHLPIFLSQLQTSFALFISNSMPVRDADTLLFPTSPLRIFANRGISGIDGNIATAIGIATSLQKPIIAVLGDLTSLHDLNSLLPLKSKSIPIIFIIINNGGGGIFSFLPVAKVLSNSAFETSFAGKHTYCFSEFSSSLNLLYFSPDSIYELQKSILEAQEKAVPTIIEIKTDREENYTLHTEFLLEMRLPMTTGYGEKPYCKEQIPSFDSCS
ncbi:MAG: 2-succinyl-5-enolpyruvyl-6-hydroxy-3-cyclohexene-1-carboxylic-acid synthase [Chlamydiales bacterium]